MPAHGPTPDRIMELGLGFQVSKSLLAAVDLGVFEALGRASLRDRRREDNA